MKTKMLVFVSFLLLLSSATALQAQSTLPDPHDNGCWQSIDALRACQLEQYNREMDYAERCTSYPEYQCAPPSTETAISQRLGNGTRTEKASLNAGYAQSAAPTSRSQVASTQIVDSK